MSKHQYISSQYIASTLTDYCRNTASKVTGYNFRNVKQHDNQVVFDIGATKCKLNIKGMVKNNPLQYFSKLEMSAEDSLKEAKEMNLILPVKRSRNGRVSGNHLEFYGGFVQSVCQYCSNYQKNTTRL